MAADHAKLLLGLFALPRCGNISVQNSWIRPGSALKWNRLLLIRHPLLKKIIICRQLFDVRRPNLTS